MKAERQAPPKYAVLSLMIQLRDQAKNRRQKDKQTIIGLITENKGLKQEIERVSQHWLYDQTRRANASYA